MGKREPQSYFGRPKTATGEYHAMTDKMSMGWLGERLNPACKAKLSSKAGVRCSPSHSMQQFVGHGSAVIPSGNVGLPNHPCGVLFALGPLPLLTPTRLLWSEPSLPDGRFGLLTSYQRTLLGNCVDHDQSSSLARSMTHPVQHHLPRAHS